MPENPIVMTIGLDLDGNVVQVKDKEGKVVPKVPVGEIRLGHFKQINNFIGHTVMLTVQNPHCVTYTVGGYSWTVCY